MSETKERPKIEIDWDDLSGQWAARLPGPGGAVVRAPKKRALEDFLDWVEQKERARDERAQYPLDDPA